MTTDLTRLRLSTIQARITKQQGIATRYTGRKMRAALHAELFRRGQAGPLPSGLAWYLPKEAQR